MAFVENTYCKECDSPVIKEVTGFNCPSCGWRSKSQVYNK